ncbi:MAG TPA: hypothetical protein VGE53_02305 [Candidatus Paceibacterota bacterium]
MTTNLSRFSASFMLATLLLMGLPLAARAATQDIALTVKNVTMIPKPPTCEARASKKVMTSGSSVDIVWKSKDAVKMVGLVQGEKEWPADGRQKVTIAVRGKHEFPMTFIGKNGATSTCTAKVFVHAKKR